MYFWNFIKNSKISWYGKQGFYLQSNQFYIQDPLQFQMLLNCKLGENIIFKVVLQIFTLLLCLFLKSKMANLWEHLKYLKQIFHAFFVYFLAQA